MIELKIKPTDWVYGGNSPLSTNITNPDFWDKELPIVEFQIINGIQTMACVSYTAENSIEIQQIHIIHKEENYNDQYIAILSGTTMAGNTYNKVIDTIRKYGMIKQSSLIFKGGTFKEYIDPKNITQEMLDEGKEWLKKWNVYREWVHVIPEVMFEALGSAPLMATVKFTNSKDEILNPTGKPDHSILITNSKYGEWWEVFDSLNKTKIKYAWNYKFGAVLKLTLQLKNKIMFTPKDNELYQLVEGRGGFAMGLDGKLIIDETAKILSSFIIRNKGDIKGKTNTLTLEQWNKSEHIDLKGRIIN